MWDGVLFLMAIFISVGVSPRVLPNDGRGHCCQAVVVWDSFVHAAGYLPCFNIPSSKSKIVSLLPRKAFCFPII